MPSENLPVNEIWNFPIKTSFKYSMKPSTLFWLWLLILGWISSITFAQNWEHGFLQTVHTNRIRSLDPLAKGLSYSTMPIAMAYPLTELLLDKQPEKPRLYKFLILSGGLAAESAISYGLKAVIKRNRPFVVYDDVEKLMDVSTSSFPSGHTGAAFYTATMASLEHPEWYVIAPTALWAGSVAWSRMHLGVHYPSDVLAGMVIGVGTAWLTHQFQQWYSKKDKMKWLKKSTKPSASQG